MKIKPKKIEVGDVFVTSSGNSVVVIEYINSRRVLVEFVDGFKYRRHVPADVLRSGKIRNPCAPAVFGIGFVGNGLYKPRENGRKSVAYNSWDNMFTRCYSSKFLESQPTYRGCSVHPAWHNFQNFAEWFCSQHYEPGWQLDKDILVKGNREYRGENCSLVPRQINMLFVVGASKLGDLPIGVKKEGNKFYSQLSMYGKSTHLGSFTSPELAFQAYKTRKEAYIKEMADLYRDKIREDVYDAMYQYTIDITD